MGTSKLQRLVGENLRRIVANTQVYENYRPYWLCDHKGRRLELDFYFPDHDMAIEVQGAQHYQYTPHFHSSYESFLEMKERDYNKREICTGLGIKLLEISNEEDLESLWPEICQGLSVKVNAEFYRKPKQKKIKTLDDSHLNNHISRFKMAKQHNDPFFIRAVYVRAKAYFTSVFNGSFIRRCSAPTLQEFIALSENARETIRSQRTLLRTQPALIRRGRSFRSELNRISQILSPKIKKKHRGNRKPRPYLRAKKVLHLEQLQGGHFLVYGGTGIYKVTKTESGYNCECLATTRNGCFYCSHKYRVEIELEARENDPPVNHQHAH